MTQLVNIDALASDGRVLVGGVEHAVHGINAEMLTVLRGEGDNVEKLLTVLADRVPTLGRDLLKKLELPQLEAILDVSMAGKKAAEDAAPNAAGPVATSTPA